MQGQSEEPRKGQAGVVGWGAGSSWKGTEVWCCTFFQHDIDIVGILSDVVPDIAGGVHVRNKIDAQVSLACGCGVCVYSGWPSMPSDPHQPLEPGINQWSLASTTGA